MDKRGFSLTQNHNFMSVKITGFKTIEANGKKFNKLELSDSEGMKMEVSATTGLPYLTSSKTYISCTFDDEQCQALIGTTMEGSLVKEDIEPVEYQDKFGNTKTISHRYVYVPDVDTKALMSKSNTNPLEEVFA